MRQAAHCRSGNPATLLPPTKPTFPGLKLSAERYRPFMSQGLAANGRLYGADPQPLRLQGHGKRSSHFRGTQMP
jgi:hypothetical protein